jgi:hypothetical protein
MYQTWDRSHLKSFGSSGSSRTCPSPRSFPMEAGPPGSTPSLEILQESHDAAVACTKLFELLSNNHILNDEVIAKMAKLGVKTIAELACCFGTNGEAEAANLLRQWQAACAPGWALASGEILRRDPPTRASDDILNIAGLIRRLQNAAADDDPAQFEPGWPLSLRCPADGGGPTRAQAHEDLGRYTASHLEAAGQCRPGASYLAVVVNPPQGLPRQNRPATYGSSSTLPLLLDRLCRQQSLTPDESKAPVASADDNDKRRRLH